MEPSAELRAEVVRTGVLRRVWRVTGPVQCLVEWNVFQGGLDSVAEYERVLVDGEVAARDLALTRWFVPRFDFHVLTTAGPVPASVEVQVTGFSVAAVRLSIDGACIYLEGNPDLLASAETNFPRPGSNPEPAPSDLPLPAVLQSNSTEEDPSVPWELMLAPLALRIRWPRCVRMLLPHPSRCTLA